MDWMREGVRDPLDKEWGARQGAEGCRSLRRHVFLWAERTRASNPKDHNFCLCSRVLADDCFGRRVIKGGRGLGEGWERVGRGLGEGGRGLREGGRGLGEGAKQLGGIVSVADD